jgi:hypothetical protein
MQSAAVTDTKTPITIATVTQSMPKKNESTIVPSGKGIDGCIRQSVSDFREAAI